MRASRLSRDPHSSVAASSLFSRLPSLGFAGGQATSRWCVLAACRRASNGSLQAGQQRHGVGVSQAAQARLLHICTRPSTLHIACNCVEMQGAGADVAAASTGCVQPTGSLTRPGSIMIC